MNVSDMAAEGLTKLKHVGGWAIRKELERCRRYIRQHLYSQSSETRQSVQIAHPKGELLEKNAIIQFSWLKKNTNFPGTLEVIENTVCSIFPMRCLSAFKEWSKLELSK